MAPKPEGIAVRFEPNDLDVISTKLRNWNQDHPGNLAYADLLVKYASQLPLLTNPYYSAFQAEFADEIIRIITEENDGRFLKLVEHDPEICIHMNYKSCMRKVSLGLKNKQLALQKRGDPSVGQNVPGREPRALRPWKMKVPPNPEPPRPMPKPMVDNGKGQKPKPASPWMEWRRHPEAPRQKTDEPMEENGKVAMKDDGKKTEKRGSGRLKGSKNEVRKTENGKVAINEGGKPPAKRGRGHLKGSKTKVHNSSFGHPKSSTKNVVVAIGKDSSEIVDGNGDGTRKRTSNSGDLSPISRRTLLLPRPQNDGGDYASHALRKPENGVGGMSMQGVVVPFEPNDQDVISDIMISTKRNWNQDHPGNVAYAELIDEYAPQLPHPTIKALNSTTSACVYYNTDYCAYLEKFAVEIVRIITEGDGRFLKIQDGAKMCIHMDYRACVHQVKHGLKNKQLALLRRGNPSVGMNVPK